VLGAIAEQCWDRGHCTLSIDAIADEALVSRRTVYYALRSARDLGLIREAGGLIRIVGPKWQALLREQERRDLR
jgi:AcrR family transcriptional regulator